MDLFSKEFVPETWRLSFSNSPAFGETVEIEGETLVFGSGQDFSGSNTSEIAQSLTDLVNADAFSYNETHNRLTPFRNVLALRRGSSVFFFSRLANRELNISESLSNVLLTKEFEPDSSNFSDVRVMLDAVTSDTVGNSLENFHSKILVNVIASSVSSGAIVSLDGSLDASNWIELDSLNVSGNGVFELFSEKPYRYLRAVVSSYSDGSYTVKVRNSN